MPHALGIQRKNPHEVNAGQKVWTSSLDKIHLYRSHRTLHLFSSASLERFCPASKVDGLTVLCGRWPTSSAESMRLRVVFGHETLG